MTARLVDRTPQVSPEALVDQMVPPPMFDDVSFDSYIPDPDERHRPRRSRPGVSSSTGRRRRVPARRVFSASGRRARRRPLPRRGFGVGKTHLLASIFHQMPEPKAFATFVELTHVVGALGFTASVERLSQHSVICIDEFELDDPGDTMLVSRLLTELTAKGCVDQRPPPTRCRVSWERGDSRPRTSCARSASWPVSSTPSASTVPTTGTAICPRPRTRTPTTSSPSWPSAPRGATLDEFDALCKHLGTLHPSKYKGARRGRHAGVRVRGARRTGSDGRAATRRPGGPSLRREHPVDGVRANSRRAVHREMLAGGYRKKYLRATSRLLALSRFAEKTG